MFTASHGILTVRLSPFQCGSVRPLIDRSHFEAVLFIYLTDLKTLALHFSTGHTGQPTDRGMDRVVSHSIVSPVLMLIDLIC